MRKVSRETVITFNETIRAFVSEEKLNHFFEVTEKINQLIAERAIFTKAKSKAI